MPPATTTTGLAKLARLHAGLLELASVIATTDQSELLDAIARTISEALGWGTVVVNVYRPAWDDYEVQAVYGSTGARDALLGDTAPWSAWAPLISDRYKRRGAYLVRDFDWDTGGGVTYRPEALECETPDGWTADDALFVLLRARDSSISGVLSVDEPGSGRAPADDDIDALVAIAAHAEVALQHARETASLRGHRAALEHFHEVFSGDRESAPPQELLGAVSRGINAALGFERVDVELFDVDGRGEPVARLLIDAYEREGCHLMTAAQASELAPELSLGPPSRNSGRGPLAWRDHRLFVALWASTGELLALMKIDEPTDRRLPRPETLQTLRLIGDQAASRLESAARLDELRYLANHDFLTGLGNRRAFMDMLEAEVARAARYQSRFTLALCDVDHFKELNDRFGHPAGDEALRRTARVMEAGIRRSDRAFRIGGDEFALLLVEATARATQDVIDRIETALREPERADAPTVRVSFGAVGSSGADDAETLLRRADEAMYTVKRSRRRD